MVAPLVDQAYGDSPPAPASQAETAVLQFLGLFFGVIILEGLFLAASVRARIMLPRRSVPVCHRFLSQS